MSLEQIADRIIETDVLVMGGGIAGCSASAKAAEHGLNVTLVEKAKPERSGSASLGISGIGMFPRDGLTALDLVQRWGGWQTFMSGGGRYSNPNTTYKLYCNSFWALEELEKFGIPMKETGDDYCWVPTHISSERVGLRVPWQDVKPLMAKAARERGVNVLERTMIVDLLTNKGTVVGATAINTRTGEFTVIKAKATIISTGEFTRCYDPETPLPWKYKFEYHLCPATISGDGWAAAYRAGAELTNMYNTGMGFRIRDDLTMPYGFFPNNEGLPMRTFTWNGQEVMNPNTGRYTELERKGLTPIYHSLEHIPDDWHKRIEVGLIDQRMISIKIAEDRGFNPKTHRYELMANRAYNFGAPAGIYIDEDFKTSLNGLYAVGNSAAGFQGCGPATIGGMLLGISLPTAINESREPVVDENQVESQKQIALAPLAVKDGTPPMELECAIRHICERYVGQFKSEGKLGEGLRRLGSLRRVFLPQLMAKNPHYLMRCLEVRNIMDLAEVHLHDCLERKETRGGFIRIDYPEKDSSLDTHVTTYHRAEDGKMMPGVREMPELKA